MKAFIASLVILVLLSILVIWNSFFVVDVLDQLKEDVKMLDIQNEATFDDIKTGWEKYRFFIAISTPHGKLDDIEKVIEVLDTKLKNNELEGFYEYKAQLLVCIEEIQSPERVSWDSIF